jgi:hypothetical protein
LALVIVGACQQRAPDSAVPPRAAPSPVAASASGQASSAATVSAAAAADSVVAPPSPSGAGPAAVVSALPSASPWSGLRACQEALPTASRPRAGRARVGTWNVRWYPDGVPGKRSKEGTATDLDWLACSIALLGVDVLAVQEFKTHPGAVAATAELTGTLDRLTGGHWRAELDECENVAGQHVGVLYDAARVQALGFATYGGINPHGIACKDQLRPGFGGYFRFPGGLDLHLISVHLKSGGERRSLTLRQQSLAALPAAIEQAQQLAVDTDVVFAGDFNTMGCSRCSPKVTPAEELADVGTRGGSGGRQRVPPTVACSEYYRGRAGLLDHFVVTRDLAEMPSGTRARAGGICGELACARLRASLPAQHHLSDHCPVVLELDDVDRD